MIAATDTPIILFDGTSVSNPGIAAAATVVILPDGRNYTVSHGLAFASTQQAKYVGLIMGLRKAKQLACKKIAIKGEDDLILKQVKGFEPITSKSLDKLYQEVQRLLLSFEQVNLECISKEQNRAARSAVNRCIGAALGKANNSPATPSTPLHPEPVISPHSPLNQRVPKAEPSPSLESLDQRISQKETLINLPFSDAFQEDKGERAAAVHQPSKETIPSLKRVEAILELMESLSPQERSQLAQEMVKSSHWVNLLLKTIATQMPKRK